MDKCDRTAVFYPLVLNKSIQTTMGLLHIFFILCISNVVPSTASFLDLRADAEMKASIKKITQK